MTDAIARSLHPNGLRVVTETLAQLRSVTIGAWVGTGARDETDVQAGTSHFLEHLLFKGSADRSAREIAETIENVGGEMNAFTSHEQTVFYVRVPSEHLELATDVLSDVVWNPAFRADEVETERQVILEEIGMRDDTPDDLVHDLFGTTIFPQHVLGREVIGFSETVAAMSRESIREYHAAHYVPSNVVFAAAGDLDHDQFATLVGNNAPQTSAHRPARTNADAGVTKPLGLIERDTEQAHLVMGTRGFAQHDDDRYAFTVLNHVVGGGMSSRLFQEVREMRGLAYSVYSFRAAYEDAGFLGIYAGTAVERVHETLEVIHAQLDRLIRDGSVTTTELDAAKSSLKGSLVMSLETSSSRMRRLGRGELVDGEIPSLDELAARVDRVTLDDVARVVDRVLRDQPRSLAVVGPFEASDFAAAHA